MTIIICHDKSSTPVPLNDRSFNYGDGFFTTILTQHKRTILLDYHLKRLKQAAEVLGFGQVDWDKLVQSLRAMVTAQPSVIKVLVSRGAGGRGYSPAGLSPLIYLTAADYPTFYQGWRDNGIQLGISPIQLGLNPLLAGLKHCNRLEQVLIKKALDKQTYQDVMVCDLTGCVVECSASNLFWQTDGQWFTPTIDVAGVDGVMRQFLIDNILGLTSTKKVKQTPAALHQASSVFICNSLMGIVPVHSIDSSEGNGGEGIVHYDIRLARQLSLELNLELDKLAI